MGESSPDESTLPTEGRKQRRIDNGRCMRTALVAAMFFGGEMRKKARKENGKNPACLQSVRSPCANGIIKGDGAAKRKIYKGELRAVDAHAKERLCVEERTEPFP